MSDPYGNGARLIDGKAAAARLRTRIADAVTALGEKSGVTPGLAVVLVGQDPASEVYVRSKSKATKAAGMQSFVHELPADTSIDALLALIGRLNADDSVHGILVQLPLPPHMDASRVIEAIAPHKDVDGFHPLNAGLLTTGQPLMVPCTPLGCMLLLSGVIKDFTGLEAVVIGRSNIVGKPVAQLLQMANATVTLAHSRTRDLPGVCRRADIVVAAVGRPEIVKAEWIKPGAAVIDVGINRVERDGIRRLVGDVDFDAVFPVAGAITPVPGGVGPMTIACLLANTVAACSRTLGLAHVTALDFQSLFEKEL